MAQITSEVQLTAQGRPQSRAEQLADAIRSAIGERGLGAGDFFGTLESIREQTGLARTTVGEAVKLLRDRGVLVVRPGRRGGLFVARTTPLVRLRHTLMDVDEDPSTIADAIELRESLEELIAVRAAAHRTDEDVRALRELLAHMEAAATWDDFMHGNWELHRRIALICPNLMARTVYESTLGFLTGGRARQAGDVAADYWEARLDVHRRLVTAIATGDSGAVRAAVAAHAAPV
ncbi:FCD domain-containing protein [Brevibacterium sp. 5221]|uniref:FCD domain-containing protein n=1 Tax=Brevibacterium rongguiense TaxID=2695267 RepID=A0A6N9H9C6_9MICO|nr:FCD domain-containing protein [Brevibacterium rongguiense]MYM20647.1 FCD domain-containing protein [Brevibacterium rongguiense]